jgi:uncharacterized protein YbgA (DUF1722 family)
MESPKKSRRLRVTPRCFNMVGYFREHLEGDSREELATLIDDNRGLVPLILPITLVRHYVGKFDIALLAARSIAPHPKELMLCNHV